MKYSTSYSLKFATRATGVVNDVRLTIRGAEFVLHDVADDGRTGKATITIPVDPVGLSIRVGATPLDGGLPQKGIHVPESMAAGGIIRSAVRVLSFAFEVVIEFASLSEQVLMAESEADRKRLKELDSLAPFEDLNARISLHPPRFQSIDTETLDKLLAREVGLALYSDALRLSTPIGRFRELWRVLESAFGQKDSDLLSSLANYEPAVKLECGYEELRELHILRGQASHAESSAGLDEYHRVSSRVEALLPRLESLAVEVLLTKKSWGSRGLTAERLAPLRTYVNKDGVPVLVV
jgi:hypothetical protein